MISSELVKRKNWNNIWNLKNRGQKDHSESYFSLVQASNGLQLLKTSCNIVITPLLPSYSPQRKPPAGIKSESDRCTPDSRESHISKKHSYEAKKSPVPFARLQDSSHIHRHWPKRLNPQSKKVAICKISPPKLWPICKKHSKEKEGQLI